MSASNLSLAEVLAELSEEEQRAYLENLNEDEADALGYNWDFLGRPEQHAPVGDWSIWMLLAGRGFGKGLAVDTLIPTPEGFKAIGDMVAGDELFDESGRICSVVKAHAPYEAEEHIVTFSDNSTLVACIDHQWVTWTHADRKAYSRAKYEDSASFPDEWPTWRSGSGLHGPTIKTTSALIATLTHSKRSDTNHCVPVCAPLVLPEMQLPIEPYELGYWLGNGAASGPYVYGHMHDAKEFAELVDCAWVKQPDKEALTFSARVAALSGVAKLCLDKRLPSIYLRASAKQRLLLLQGLMDSDGYCGDNSHVEFCNTKKHLADAVYELAVSLGQKPVLAYGRAMLYGVDCGPKWRVTWRPTINPFRMARKSARLKPCGSQALRNHHRMIVAIQPTGKRVWMRCLTVDSRHSTYLAGKAMIPTHNTRTGSEWIRSQVCGATPLSKGIAGRVAIIGETAADCRDVLVEGQSGILAVHPKEFRPIYEVTKRRLTWPNGATATLYNATEPDQLRGPQHEIAICDELCLVNTTLITTSEGTIPISQVNVNDKVLTRSGFKRVLHAGQTSVASVVYELSTQGGNSIVGTAGHPVYVDGKGFTKLSNVNEGDVVWCLKSQYGVVNGGIAKTMLANEPRIIKTKVTSIAAHNTVSDVYNIEVEDAQEYFANGILVHNCKWRYANETWDMLQFGLRLGVNPRTAITTTPRPIPLIRTIMEQPGTVVTRGSTLDNRSNLAPKFIKNVFERYDGTRLGRQELYGEVVDDVPGALWERGGFDANRVKMDHNLPDMRRVLVAIDPAAQQSVASDETSETGIIVVGLGVDGFGYVIDDVSCREGPTGWAKRATAVYNYYEADAFVAEVNQGGDMVTAVIRTEAPTAKIITVRASKGKVTRAEPISALYSKGRVKHIGNLPLLEDQMVLFTPFGILGNGDADRVDALVWGLTELFPRFISIEGMTARGNREIKGLKGRGRNRIGANRSTGY